MTIENFKIAKEIMTEIDQLNSRIDFITEQIDKLAFTDIEHAYINIKGFDTLCIPIEYIYPLFLNRLTDHKKEKEILENKFKTL